MGKDLVFAGAGHAHLTALVNLADYVQRGHRVTVIGPIERHYYSGMGPGMLSGIYAPREIRFDIRRLAEDRGARFVQGRVTRVDPANRVLTLDDGAEIPYDVVSFNIGSFVPADLVDGPMRNVFPVKPIVNLLKARQAIIDAIEGTTPRLVVLGGGPAGVELAGNIRRLVNEAKRQARITLVTGRRLLPSFVEKARSLAIASLRRRDVEVIEGVRIERIGDGHVVLSDGKAIPYDLVFPAVGVRPYQIFRESGLPTAEDGSLLVTQYLHSVEHPTMFGGGDCISLEGQKLDRVGVYAVRQNPILQQNLMAALEGGEMAAFIPQKTYMLILNLGDGTGIFVRNSWVWAGRLAFKLKDYIDRSFMKRFQVSGEQEDTTDYPEG
ncbi:MAG: FAD-dependent oxidoreductase [Desulfomonile tiedjei]|nr:FAD-dependent oxidoreductase [Desulfomonile tiedjei]